MHCFVKPPFRKKREHLVTDFDGPKFRKGPSGLSISFLVSLLVLVIYIYEISFMWKKIATNLS